MWIKTLRKFDWDVPGKGGRVTLSHEAGATVNVPRACGEQAIKSGAAVAADPPRREDTKGGGDALQS